MGLCRPNYIHRKSVAAVRSIGQRRPKCVYENKARTLLVHLSLSMSAHNGAEPEENGWRRPRLSGRMRPGTR